MRTWKLQDLLSLMSSLWYWAALSLIVGGLIGWGVCAFTPHKYQGSVDLYVGIDAYRAPSDRYIAEVAQKPVFQRLDDYKNWQMGQLEAIAFSDDFIRDTLTKLQALDSYWDEYSPEKLRGILNLSWRNAGLWHLNATVLDQKRALEAVETWRDVILESVNTALQHSREVKSIDGRLYLIEEEIGSLEDRQAILGDIRIRLDDWKEKLASYEQSGTLDDASRWEIESFALYGMDWSAGWYELINDFPSDTEPVISYISWIERVIDLIDTELDEIPGRLETLEEKRVLLRDQYEQEGLKSLGLSANIIVEPVLESSPTIRDLHPIGLFMLIGSLIGLILWIFFLLIWVAHDTA